MIRKIELLAPAKNADVAIAAIMAGADAVYIGAEQFSARAAASNSVADIAKVCDFAHQYYAKVYVALNTLLNNEELAEAEKLIGELYKIGVDGLIVQDAGLLELDLPPIPLIASTQMDNSSAEKIKFIEDVGFSRAILARELNIEQIKQIRSQTNIELECFVHGSICVGASGRCLMSYAAGGRSGNRGQCAQPCRKLYSLKDSDGKTIVKNRYLLSLKDMNRSEELKQLIDAGIGSFKIEGRLKDVDYVVNTVGYYRKKLDDILAKKNSATEDLVLATENTEDTEKRKTKNGFTKSSSGTVKLDFEPNLIKTFNRGFTDYGISGNFSNVGSNDTPKSVGEFIGIVKIADRKTFIIDGKKVLNNGDGICFFDRLGNLSGTTVNGMDGRKVWPQKTDEIFVGQEIYRNYDKLFCDKLNTNAAERKIAVKITIAGLTVNAVDEDGNSASVKIDAQPVVAEKKPAAKQAFYNQLTRLGNTFFECNDFKFESGDIYFVPVSKLNEARRQLVEQLIKVRAENRPIESAKILKNNFPYPQKHLIYSDNVLNKKAQDFYRRHGVETIEPAAESGLDLTSRIVMTTKYCLQKELGLCRGKIAGEPAEPMTLTDEDGREYEISFLCGECGMEIVRKNKK
ncbi:MAG: peptidase U32 family protein [Sedimentisphaerales bacterium]